MTASWMQLTCASLLSRFKNNPRSASTADFCSFYQLGHIENDDSIKNEVLDSSYPLPPNQ